MRHPMLGIIFLAAVSGMSTAQSQDEPKKSPGLHVLPLRKARATELEPVINGLIQALHPRKGEITLAADAGTNVLVLSSDADTYKAIESLVAKLDQAAAEPKPGAPVELSIVELLNAYSARLGRKFIHSRDMGLENRRVVVPPLPDAATPQEALGVLETVLKSQSLFLLQSEGSASLYTVEQSPLMNKKGVPVLGPAEAVPAGDGVYTKSFKIKAPREAQAVLINMVSFPQACLSNESAGVLLVTDYASNLRRFEKILSSMTKE